MAEALPELPMAETVMVRLMRIGVFGLGNFFEPVFRELGLTENSFHVLCLLMAGDQGRASPSELSELVGTTRANMTRILDSLVNDGLASRAIEARDGRRHVIRITTAGCKVASEAGPRLVEPLKRAFSGLDADELASLDRLLRKAIVSFDKGATPLRVAA
ncbi:MAG: MarR family transcriptional regulator [Nevskia sp.]|nr:MarR family transcriptional regulator [Nevskia sp.]